MFRFFTFIRNVHGIKKFVQYIVKKSILMTSVLSKPFVCKKEMFCIWNLAETAQFRK